LAVVHLDAAVTKKATLSAALKLAGYARGKHTLKVTVDHLETVLVEKTTVAHGKKSTKTVEETKAVTKTLKIQVVVA
jgi:hypothetical protein